VILTQVKKRNDIESKNKLYTAVKNEFQNSDFLVDFLVQDFLYNNTDYNEYKVSLTLDEVTDVKILPIWFKNVFLKKLGFEKKRFEFIEKHKLIGKMRFLQIRSKPEVETCIDKNNKIEDFKDNSEIAKSYCYSEKFVEDQTDIKFNCREMKKYYSLDDNNSAKENQYIKSENYCKNHTEYNQTFFKNPCSLNNHNTTENSLVCELFKNGLKHRDLSKENFPVKGETQKEKFFYNGEFNNYDYDKAYYFDIDYNLINEYNNPDKKIEDFFNEFGNFVFRDWIDLNSRLLMISFNCYQTIEDQDIIFSISLIIEFSKTQAMKKIFSIDFYTKYIDFDNLNFNTILGSFSYFIFLFLYSSLNLFANMKTLFKESLNIFYKQFIQFIMDFSLNCLILLVLMLRIITALMQSSHLNSYRDNGFKEYFPIYYYRSGVEQIVSLLEIIMICMITINTLNSFYFEFFARIFLTFKYAWKYIFAYLVIYFIIIIAYAASCNILYGSYIACKFSL